MIRLNRLIERGRRHPVLGPLLVLLVVLLLVLTMVHEGHESVAADAGLLCVGIALLLMVTTLAPPRRRFVVFVDASTPGRGPPVVPVDTPAAMRGRPSDLPLRL